VRKINLTYYQSNQSRLIRNKIKSQNAFLSPLPSFWAQLHSEILYLLSPSSTGGWGMGVVVSPSHFAASSYSRSFPAPAWGPSHRRQTSTNFSNVSPSHELQFFTDCCSVGPSHRVQSFSNRLLQHGSPTGSQVLPANLLQRGLLSMGAHVMPGACSTAGFPQGHSLL